MHTGGEVAQIKCLLPRIVGEAKTGAKDEGMRRKGVTDRKNKSPLCAGASRARPPPAAPAPASPATGQPGGARRRATCAGAGQASQDGLG